MKNMFFSSNQAVFSLKNCIFVAPKSNNPINVKRVLNRLKVVLAEKWLTNKWLAEQLGKDPAIVF